uniref:Uncharacterized protein n=1 Tax=viral metagenome TaxID=1070528 RepID=A0A6M3JVL8_9ZZZZ
MKIQWLEDKFNAEELRKVCPKVKSVSSGWVVVGHRQTKDINGKDFVEPIREKGIEIEFEDNATEQDLKKLDAVLPFKRAKIKEEAML